MSPSPCSFTTALDESFALMVSWPIIFCSTMTYLPFSQVGNQFLTSWHNWSAHIFYVYFLQCLQHIDIYFGSHTFSAHDIPGPIPYMQFTGISQLRLAGMLYVPLGNI